MACDPTWAETLITAENELHRLGCRIARQALLPLRAAAGQILPDGLDLAAKPLIL
jgi:hypothetical protein